MADSGVIAIRWGWSLFEGVHGLGGLFVYFSAIVYFG